MKKTLIAAVALIAAVSLTSSFASAAVAPPPAVISSAGTANPGIVWALGGCVVSIIISASAASLRDHRELTAPEAWTCGVLYWLESPMPKAVVHRAKHH